MMQKAKGDLDNAVSGAKSKLDAVRKNGLEKATPLTLTLTRFSLTPLKEAA